MKCRCYEIFVLIFLISGSCKSQPVNNAPILPHYREFGSGKPVLVINGGPGMNSEGFASLATLISTKYKAIIFDQRGTGKSLPDTVNESTITMDAMVEDMELLRKHLKIKEWIVLGHSFGGMLASYYAAKYPESIKALILSSSGGINLDFLTYINNTINSNLTKEERDAHSYWNKKITDGDTTCHARLQRTKAMASAYLSQKQFIPVIAERLLQGNSKVNQLVFADLSRIKFNCTEKLQLFKNPVLIIQGKQDIIKEETALKTKQALPQAEILLIDNCGHYGWLEQRNIYITGIFIFLEKIKYENG